MRQETLRLHDFPFVCKERIRYNDMDAHGHVNNAVYLTYLEAGRVAMVHERTPRLVDDGCQFVVANMNMDFYNEIVWPGCVEIGIRLLRLGGSSLTLEQVIFQNGKCAARAEIVMVQASKTSRKSQPFTQDLRVRLQELQVQA